MASGGITVEVDGLLETMKAIKGTQDALQTNGELRDVAGRSAGELGELLRASASSSGVPVAPRVADSIRVKRDRIPVVSIGGGRRVGRRGAPASSLVWGSEQGPKGDVNHWAVPPSSGYWIAPAVERYSSRALQNFQRAVYEILHRQGLA